MLGLHFAGETVEPAEYALACYASAVFEKLEISPLEATRDDGGVQVERAGDGYDPEFLPDQRVDVPSPASDAIETDYARTKAGSVIRDYTHFSLAMLAIIGHPAGVPKRVEAGPATTVSGTQITYNDIDTLGGNSGSGISRSPDGALVGVHTNGGCNVQGTGSNFGSPIVAIRNNSPTIRNLGGGIATFKGPDDGTGTAIKFIDDGGTLNKVRDDLTLKNPDDGTGTALKAIDDGATLNKFRDDISTVKALDDISTIKSRDDVLDPGKQFGDVKTPALDKAPGADLGGGVLDPGGPIAGGRAQPFILATPHHATEWAGGPLQEGPETDLQELEALLAQAVQCVNAVGQMYLELRAAYEELASQMRGT